MNAVSRSSGGLATSQSGEHSSSGRYTFQGAMAMTKANTLSIAKEFWPFPAGRVEKDGPYNGEKFRKEHLIPALEAAKESNSTLEVSLDGLKSCGSSFLESAFGGLIRYDRYKKSDLKHTLKIVLSNPSLERYKLSIERHIDRATVE